MTDCGSPAPTVPPAPPGNAGAGPVLFLIGFTLCLNFQVKQMKMQKHMCRGQMGQ